MYSIKIHFYNVLVSMLDEKNEKNEKKKFSFIPYCSFFHSVLFGCIGFHVREFNLKDEVSRLNESY